MLQLAGSMRKMGWYPDLPDHRDYSQVSCLSQVGLGSPLKATTVSKVDLRKWCSPIEDQGDLGSCTAHAAAGLLEWYHKKAFGKYLNMSRRFIYKATRNLDEDKGDTGAFLRTTMKALVMFGAPPEQYYPYDIKRFDEEPQAFHYALAHRFLATQYYRIVSATRANLLDALKNQLVNNLPFMFGFTVYSSMNDNAWIPEPQPGDKAEGGHAIMAVGFDDTQGDGAFLNRNSWGTGWGWKGYGWLPYAYVLKGLATDFWSLISTEWVDTDLFKEEVKGVG